MRYVPFDKGEVEIRVDQIGTLVDIVECHEGFFYNIVHLDGTTGLVPVQCVEKLGPADGYPEEGLPERTAEQHAAIERTNSPGTPSSDVDYNDCGSIPRGYCPTEHTADGIKFKHHCCTQMRRNALNHAEEVARLRHRAERQVQASQHWAQHAKAQPQPQPLP